MQSTTGFGYFVVFASVISLFMAIFFAIEFPVIVPFFEQRGSRKAYLTQSLQVLLFMLLASAVSLLTWAAVEPNVIGLPYKALAILYMVLFFLYAMYAHKDFPMAKSSFQKYSVHIGLVFYMIMLPGLICFAISYKQLMDVQDFREIDMLIQDTKIQYQGNYDGKGNGAYLASMQVHWGKEWACPKKPSVNCQAWIVEEDCLLLTENSTTTETEFATNAKLVQDCLLEKYKLPAIGFLDKELYPQLQQDEDDNTWPEIAWYGTCSDTCQTKPISSDFYQFAERVKLTGLVLSCAGAILFFIYYCIIFGKDMVDCCNIGCNKKKFGTGLRHLPIIQLFASSDRVAPTNQQDRDTSVDRDDDVSDAFTIPPEIIQEEMEELRELQQLEAGRSNTTPQEPPVMVEAAILYSDDEEDYTDDDYSDEDDDSGEDYGSSGDEDSEEDGHSDNDDEEEEEEASLNSSRYQSLDEIDLSVDASCCVEQEEEESNEVDTKCKKTGTSISDEVEIDV